MNKVQMKYNFLHILYWMNTLSIVGFVAVLLQSKGLSNTEIGIVTGASSMTTIFLSPILSAQCAKIKKLSLQQLLIVFLTIECGSFLSIGFLPLSKAVLMILYIGLYALNISTVPLVSTIAMNYIEEGKKINFGLSRGLGSISYAVSAVIAGQLVSHFAPSSLCLLCIGSAVICMLILIVLPPSYSKQKGQNTEEGTNIVSIALNYRKLTGLLLGFGLAFAASACLGTYLINIISELGGNASMLGIATFFMAASELPCMAAAPKLMRRFGTKKLLCIAALFYIVRNITVCLAPNLPILFLGLAFQGLSYGLFTPVITYYVAENLEKKDQIMGQTMIGVMTSGVGAALGNTMGGMLQDTYGMQTMLFFVMFLTLGGAGIVNGLNILRASKKEIQLASR
ncbi:hypothetical protein C815_00226 [Firmicutes bacterium M10-2]|nr:hypothetical protein C815_00226 [Firmicutes bacterium M10-2]